MTERQPAHIAIDIIIDAEPQKVFDAITDWPAQGMWMMGTRVESLDGDGHHVGARIEAWTGAGKLGFLDTMTITSWEPPTRVDVIHTGAIVRGTGTMEVIPLPGNRSRFIWSEDLDLPLGLLGRIGWPVVKPAFAAGVRKSLKVFASMVEQGQLPRGR